MISVRRYIFPRLSKPICEHPTKDLTKNQSGQTLVEFVLLLASIVAIAFSFMRVVNTNLGDQWLQMSQTILEDENQQLRIRE